MLAINEFETDHDANQIGTLKRAGDIRCGFYQGSISILMVMFLALIYVLQKIGADASTDPIRAKANLMCFEFVFVLCMMNEILKVVEMFGQALQRNHKTL